MVIYYNTYKLVLVEKWSVVKPTKVKVTVNLEKKLGKVKPGNPQYPISC